MVLLGELSVDLEELSEYLGDSGDPVSAMSGNRNLVPDTDPGRKPG